MFKGFLPFARHSTFMLDVVVVAMVGVLPVLTWSIYTVKGRRNYQQHGRIQLGLGLVLLIAVVLFEIEMRLVGGWRSLAKDSPYMATILPTELYVHLCFAVATFLVWTITITRALRWFPRPPQPGPHSGSHRRWGWLAASLMYCTAITGWTFYWLALVAR